MQRVQFYAGILAFTGAIAVQTTLLLSPAWWLWLGSLGVAVTLLALRHGSRFTTTLFLVTAAAIVGGMRVDVATWQLERVPPVSGVGEEVELLGVVSTEPDVRERSQQFVLLTEQQQRILISTERYVTVTYGDQVRVVGRLERPQSFTTDLGREFNYPGYLRAQGILYRMSFAQVTRIETGAGQPLMALLLTGKHAFMRSIEGVLPEPQVGLAEGLLLGVKQALGADLEAAFRKTGIIHIVVLSGYNVMLVVAFVATILAVFSLWTRTIIGILAIVGFALLVGLSATVVRASIMASLVLIAPLLGRDYHILRALCFAGAAMLMVNPYLLIYDIGFQLSFLATLGLVVVAPHFETLLVKAPSRLKLKEYFIATLATQIAVSPLLLYQIGELSIVSVLVNMLVLPAVPVAMLLTFILGLVGFVSTAVAAVLALPTYWSLTYIITLAETFAAWRFAALPVAPFPFWVVVVSYVLLAGLLYWYAKRKQSLPRVFPTYQKQSLGHVSDWEIETESAVVERLRQQKKSPRRRSRRRDPPEDTPVFFRTLP